MTHAARIAAGWAALAPVLVLGLVPGLAPLPAPAQEAGAPLSAIDWLSESVAVAPGPVAAPQAPPRLPDEDPVADSAVSPGVTVTSLDDPSPDRIGLLTPAVTGLPADLWSGSTEDDVVTLTRAERVDTLPAIQDFLVTLMLAEAEPPAGAGPEGALFLARIDKLLDLGALDPALELLQTATPDTPELFRRYFDATLLTGTEDRACRIMAEKPEVAPTLPARIFCLARSGDWNAAALTLNTAQALGDVSDEDADLLARFLDPDLFEGEPDLAAPSRPSPLVFRMREAVGQGLATTILPRAFSHADLRDTMSWRTRLEAAERLARTGAISEGMLFELYALQRPAASGGIWDRARAFQALDAALGSGDGLGDALLAAWAAAQGARIEVPFATYYGPDLIDAELTGEAAEVALVIGLLSPDYELAALDRSAGDPRLDLMLHIARGDVAAFDPARRLNRAETSIRDAFTTAAPPAPLTAMAEDGRLGEALLRAVAMFSEGAKGDVMTAADALAFFRSVGLEDLARRAALQYLILDRGV